LDCGGVVDDDCSCPCFLYLISPPLITDEDGAGLRHHGGALGYHHPHRTMGQEGQGCRYQEVEEKKKGTQDNHPKKNQTAMPASISYHHHHHHFPSLLSSV